MKPLAIWSAFLVGSTLSRADLIGHWTLDESPATDGASVADSSTESALYNGTLNTNDAADHAVVGQIGGGFDLGGGGDHVSADLGTDLVLGTDPVTVTAWFNPATIATRQNYIFSYGAGDPAGRTFGMTLENVGGTAALRYRHFGGFVNYSVPSVTVASGWHHLAAVFPVGATLSGQILFYLDGALLTDQTGSTNTAQTLGIVSSLFRIGTHWQGSSSTSFIGQLDDVGYWDEALDADQIDAIYNGGLEGKDLQQSLGGSAPFAITSISFDHVTNMATITWNSTAGTQYAIDETTGLLPDTLPSPDAWSENKDSITGQAGQTTEILEVLPEHKGLPALFFRVRGQ